MIKKIIKIFFLLIYQLKYVVECFYYFTYKFRFILLLLSYLFFSILSGCTMFYFVKYSFKTCFIFRISNSCLIMNIKLQSSLNMFNFIYIIDRNTLNFIFTMFISWFRLYFQMKLSIIFLISYKAYGHFRLFFYSRSWLSTNLPRCKRLVKATFYD